MHNLKGSLTYCVSLQTYYGFSKGSLGQTSLFGLAAAEFWSSFQSTAGKPRTRHSKIEQVYWHRYCDKDLISHESLHSIKTNGIWISPRQIKLQVSNSLQVASQFKNFFTKTIALTEIIGLTFTPGQIEVEILCCGGKKRRVNT